MRHGRMRMRITTITYFRVFRVFRGSIPHYTFYTTKNYKLSTNPVKKHIGHADRWNNAHFRASTAWGGRFQSIFRQ
jgi:hypothetical protein